jgi:hypothetical protein
MMRIGEILPDAVCEIGEALGPGTEGAGLGRLVVDNHMK